MSKVPESAYQQPLSQRTYLVGRSIVSRRSTATYDGLREREHLLGLLASAMLLLEDEETENDDYSFPISPYVERTLGGAPGTKPAREDGRQDETTAMDEADDKSCRQ